LETVCLKCLRKESERRYGSAEALADDLRRFVNGEPVQARPVAVWERAVKWARRRPAITALLAAVMLVAASGAAGVVGEWHEADVKRREAEDALGRETAALAAAQQLAAEKDAALKEAQANLYLKLMNLAHREWLANNVAGADAHLNACPPELRHWE